MTREDIVVLTDEKKEEFFQYLIDKGRSETTVGTYRRYLEHLSAFLPEDKVINKEILCQWRDKMLADGMAVPTVNGHIFSVNSYLDFLEHREFQLKSVPYEKPQIETPELTWPEYLQLIQTAKALEDERACMLIKLFCNTGIRVRETPKVTVEAVDAGEIIVKNGDKFERVLLPSGLRTELKNYAFNAGIARGSLFIRRNGNPLTHSEIIPLIVKLFRKAGVPRNKANTKTLRQFYRKTREKIHAEIAAQMEGVYENMMGNGHPFLT